jgi:hypothetical protein
VGDASIRRESDERKASVSKAPHVGAATELRTIEKDMTSVHETKD